MKVKTTPILYWPEVKIFKLECNPTKRWFVIDGFPKTIF